MTTNNVSNRLNQQAADQKLIDGLTTHAQTLPSFLVAGVLTKNADIIASLEARIAAAKAAETARATWQAAVQADRDTHAKSTVLVSNVRQALQLMYAGSVDTLAEFGLTPRKARVVSPETRVAAVAKAKATRAARHTMGKKQKLEIKGTVATTAPANPPAAAPPSPSPTVPAVASATVTPRAGT